MNQPTFDTIRNDDGGGRERSPLLPDRHPNQDFFICDVLDAIPKDDMASMEHPIFSLSTRPDHRVLRYARNGVRLEIAPGARGLATIHDKDILIYCISQLVAKMNNGAEPKQELYLTAYDLLVSTNRETSGDGYRRLKEAFERLSGTRITTNLKTNEEEITEGFGLIDSWRIVRKSGSGRMSQVKVKLSDWMYNAVLGREVLTLHRDYFRLRKPLERRIYEIARKHCGAQSKWEIKLDTLQKKCGSNSPLRIFRSMIRELVKHDHLPDYSVVLDKDLVTFRNRETCRPEPKIDYPNLDAETYHDARTVAPGYDVYWLEREWRNWWVDSGKPMLQDPGKAFIAFCRKRYERSPNP